MTISEPIATLQSIGDTLTARAAELAAQIDPDDPFTRSEIDARLDEISLMMGLLVSIARVDVAEAEGDLEGEV